MSWFKLPKISVSKKWQNLMIEKTHFTISNIIRVSILIAVISLIIEQKFLTAFTSIIILLLTFLPAILQRNYRVTIPIEFEVFIVIFIYGALFLGEIKAFYTHFWWWDVFLHALSGVLLGAIGFTLVYILNTNPKVQLKMQPIFIALFALSFAIAIGTIWEIFEFAMDSIFGLSMQKTGLIDTMWDLIVDLIGAMAVAFLGYVSLKYKKVFFMERAIYKFVEKNPYIFKKIVRDKAKKGQMRNHLKKIKTKLMKQKNKKQN